MAVVTGAVFKAGCAQQLMAHRQPLRRAASIRRSRHALPPAMGSRRGRSGRGRQAAAGYCGRLRLAENPRSACVLCGT